MTADKVKSWLISLFGSTTPIISLLPKGADSVRSSDLDVPSQAGVYVRVLSSNPSEARGFDSVEVRVTVVAKGEAETYEIINKIRDATFFPSGDPKTFVVNPTSKQLLIRSISYGAIQVPPEPIGEDNSYASVLAIKIVGRDRGGPV